MEDNKEFKIDDQETYNELINKQLWEIIKFFNIDENPKETLKFSIQ